MRLAIKVDGLPKPKGSTKSYIVNGRAVTTSACKGLKYWEQRIATEAQAAMGDQPLATAGTPVQVMMTFNLPRTKAMGTKKMREAWVPHTKKPDLDKLQRAVLDALTAICYEDDSQVTAMAVYKHYAKHGEQPGVELEVMWG